MTNEERKELLERSYLLVKRGLYYAPNRQGYTGVKDRAGRYREIDALGLDGVTAIHEDEAPEFAPACWVETKLAVKDARITELEAALVQIKLAVEDEAYKITAGQPLCRHIDALNEVHEITTAALRETK